MPNKRFSNALQRIPQPVPPIWMMRQAGRYHDHYQNLKQTHTFEELCKTPVLSATTALGPIEDFDFDAAILFSDILFPLEAMGMDLSYNPGPQFAELLTENNHHKLLGNKSPINFLSFQAEAICRTIEMLPEEKSMIGFVGGPWTLLSYAMGKNKDGSVGSLSEFEWLMMQEKIIPLLQENISMQITAGAEIVMIFDSSAHQLSDVDFDKYIEILLNTLSCQFTNKIGYYAKSGIEYKSLYTANKILNYPLAGIGIDSAQPIKEALLQNKHGFIQGNFSEQIMTQPKHVVSREIDKYIESMLKLSSKERAGWICGLGHGVLKTTPQENVKLFVSKIREAFA